MTAAPALHDGSRRAYLADEASRVRLGASATTSPETLALLAADASVMVRAALALNPMTPASAMEQLVGDADERVRVLLARKLATLAPGLSEPDQVRLQRQAYEALATLVTDEAVRVRAAIADVVKEMPDAPRALVLQLARDCAASVCEPVIRFSRSLPMRTCSRCWRRRHRPPRRSRWRDVRT